MKLKMCRTQRVLALLTMYLGLVHSWDFAVSVGDELRFYTNHSVISTKRLDSQNIATLTYLPNNKILYINKQINGDAICSYFISSERNVCTRIISRNIHGIAHDPITKTVFFTDTNERTVNRISFDRYDSEHYIEINHLMKIKMDEGIPRDIVVDICKGYIYWLNTDMTKPTIERARLDGTEREVYATLSSVAAAGNNELKLQPHSLAIDQQTQTIYWVEPAPTSASQLHMAALNKNYKQAVNYKFRIDYPTYIHPSNTLTVSNRFLYSLEFGDNGACIYELSKTFDSSALRKPDTTMFLGCLGTSSQMPVGIVANYGYAEQIQGRHNCERIRRKLKVPAECDGTFCVYGEKVNGQFDCKCSPGYIGERCDVSICQNYCLQGNCTVNDVGIPECRCDAGYSGARCEIYSCHGYCLNGGECTLNEANDPVCKCVGSYEGTRCESDKKHCILARGGESNSV